MGWGVPISRFTGWGGGLLPPVPLRKKMVILIYKAHMSGTAILRYAIQKFYWGWGPGGGGVEGGGGGGKGTQPVLS